MQFTGGLTFSGAGSIKLTDTFPIAFANANVATQSLTTGSNVAFYPFATVTAGTLPYTYSNIGVLPPGLSLSSGNGLVYGNTTSVFSTSTVTFSVVDNSGQLAANTNVVSFTVTLPPYTEIGRAHV